MQILHPLQCGCGQDLTQVDSVRVHLSIDGHEFDVPSAVDEGSRELLREAIRVLISCGCHAGSFCSSCDEIIEEFVEEFVSEKKVV